MSDVRTTKYMQRFSVATGSKNTSTDPYLNHYTGSATSHSSVLAQLKEHVEEDHNIPKDKIWDASRKKILNLSDRNLLCMAIRQDELVIGGADHSVRVVTIKNGLKQIRHLYSKKYGHSDWITSVAYFEDGRIISGGMDSKICIWKGLQCVDLVGHVGSISRVRALSNDHIISSSYDRSIKLWSREHIAASLHGHSGAVLDFVLNKDSLISAGRDSTVRLWDIQKGAEIKKFIGHQGHVPLIMNIEEGLVATGSQDGTLIVWDMRLKEFVHKTKLFPTAITNLACGLVAVAADGAVLVLDKAMSFAPKCSWLSDHGTNFVYSLLHRNQNVLTGGGDGTLAVRSSSTGELISKLKLDLNALRGIEVASNGQICCITDDGNIVVT